MGSVLDRYEDDERITVHGLAGLAKRRVRDVRFLLSCEGIASADRHGDTVRVGDLRKAGLVPPRQESGIAHNRTPTPVDTQKDEYCDTCLMGGCPIHDEEMQPMTEDGQRFFDWAGGDAEKLAERCATSEKVIAQLQDELWKEQHQSLAAAARKYRTVALERPGDDDYGYWEWLLRSNSAGNELDAALGDTQREAGS